MKRRQVEALIRWLRQPAAATGAAGLKLSQADAAELADWLQSKLPAAPAAKTPPAKVAAGKTRASRAMAAKGPAGRGVKLSDDAVARLFCDGASRGNPGPAALGVVIYLGEEEIHREAEALGTLSNNQAEYRALLAGLAAVERLGLRRVAVFLDSELIVRQLQGRYKVKSPGLRPLYERARLALTGFQSWSVEHIPRAKNSVADALANSALDSL